MSIETLLINHFDVAPHQTILDLGCGRGALVESLRSKGYDAYGCDIPGDASDYKEELAARSHFRSIKIAPYQLPFDDNQFDYVVSEVVLEHVMDYESTFREVHRVLKPGGVSIHEFPARYSPIESHVFVPLATIIRNKTWLYLWAALGIRNQFQTGKSAREVAEINYSYLNAHTNYPSNREMLRHARLFSEASFREDIARFGRTPSQKKMSWKKRLAICIRAQKPYAWWRRTFVMRLLVLRK